MNLKTLIKANLKLLPKAVKANLKIFPKALFIIFLYALIVFFLTEYTSFKYSSIFGNLLVGVIIFMVFKELQKETGVSVKQERKFFVAKNKNEVISNIKTAMIEMNAEITRDFSHSGYIEAKTNFSCKSYGEILKIYFEEKKDGIVISIKSRPTLKTTIFDDGKNFENIEYFQKLMTS